MKIALIGNGKTGRFVTQSKYETKVFDSNNKFSSKEASDCDVVICFTTGEILESYIDELILSKLPVVIASTGFKFTDELKDRIKQNKLKWIYSSNFSKSLFIYKSLIQHTSNITNLDKFNLEIVDIHHKEKQDAPSGTALTIKEWFGSDIGIKSLRLDDQIGTHKFIISNEIEEIEINHIIKSRRVFADGAVLASEILMRTKETGLIKFYEVIND
jgi:4-hydroxy-tetrahydrodipicolinate reductase